jgi:hypothetical protein
MEGVEKILNNDRNQAAFRKYTHIPLRLAGGVSLFSITRKDSSCPAV